MIGINHFGWFDNIHLFKEEYGQSYEYDTGGKNFNLTKVEYGSEQYTPANMNVNNVGRYQPITAAIWLESLRRCAVSLLFTRKVWRADRLLHSGKSGNVRLNLGQSPGRHGFMPFNRV